MPLLIFMSICFAINAGVSVFNASRGFYDLAAMNAAIAAFLLPFTTYAAIKAAREDNK